MERSRSLRYVIRDLVRGGGGGGKKDKLTKIDSIIPILEMRA
jgi:hypothetical protein